MWYRSIGVKCWRNSEDCFNIIIEQKWRNLTWVRRHCNWLTMWFTRLCWPHGWATPRLGDFVCIMIELRHNWEDYFDIRGWVTMQSTILLWHHSRIMTWFIWYQELRNLEDDMNIMIEWQRDWGDYFGIIIEQWRKPTRSVLSLTDNAI